MDGSMAVDPEGYHRKQFSVVVDRMQLMFRSDGVSLEVAE
jgi:hypothetical protein